MATVVSERMSVIPRALQMALASRRSMFLAAVTFVVLLIFYLMLLPASSTGGIIGLVALPFLTAGEAVLAFLMALLLTLTLVLAVHSSRHGAGLKSTGSLAGAVLALIPSLLCCSPILPLTIAAIAAVLPAAGAAGLPLQGFIATHETLIYGIALALMAWGLYGNARRAIYCEC